MLRLCEQYCKGVSHAALIRLDVGAEFRWCETDGGGCSEAQLLQRQRDPSQWQRTGAGCIVRFFLNKLNSALDINLYAAASSYPIVMQAAQSLTRHIVKTVEQKRNEGRRR